MIARGLLYIVVCACVATVFHFVFWAARRVDNAITCDNVSLMFGVDLPCIDNEIADDNIKDEAQDTLLIENPAALDAPVKVAGWRIEALPNSFEWLHVGIEYIDGYVPNKEAVFIGIDMHGIDFDKTKFLSISMPCGELYEYTWDTFPRKTTMCRCGDPNHYVVKYDESAEIGEE